MSAKNKQAQQLARQLFTMSLVDGVISADRVTGVLQWVEKHAPANQMLVLQAYQRLISVEVARSRAVVEHAGPVAQDILDTIASAMTARYGRPIVASSKSAPSLLAGLRVRVGDDVYEASVSARLELLRAAT